MLDGKRKDHWAHTSLLAFLMAEPNRDSRRRPKSFQPDDFNPTVEKRPPTPDELDAERRKFFEGM